MPNGASLPGRRNHGRASLDEVSSEDNNKVLAKGFSGAGFQSFVPGSGVNMQFMVKDSKKYPPTGGWGFGDFTNGKPGNAALMKPASPATCRPKITTSSTLATLRETGTK